MRNKPTIQYSYDAHGNFRNMTIAEFINEVPVEGIGDDPLCEQSIMDMRVVIEYLQEKLEKAEELIIMIQGKISAQPCMSGSSFYSLKDPQFVLRDVKNYEVVSLP
jgi:hypothetical protein